MGDGTTSLLDRAETIFADLGYDVSAAGGELRAERKWRTVRVTAMADPDRLPEAGDYYCFVTHADRVARLERALRRRGPGYEWAIIGLGDDGYEVAR